MSESGNIISTCSLSKVKTGEQKGGLWDFSQKNTYTTVNTCTGEKIQQYELEELSGFGFILITVVAVAIGIWIIALIIMKTNEY